MVHRERGREARDAGGTRAAPDRAGWAAMKWLPALALLPALAGCAAGGGWAKAGADASATDAAYAECRAQAAGAIEPEIGINEDILATRQNDWQRSHVGQVASETMREQTRDRAAALVDSCMRAKGFARAK